MQGVRCGGSRIAVWSISRPDPGDARRTLLSLTLDGQRLVAKLLMNGPAVSRETLKPLNGAEQRHLLELPVPDRFEAGLRLRPRLGLGRDRTYTNDMADYLRPSSLDEALQALARPWTVLAGGTEDFYPARVGRAIDENVLDIGGMHGPARYQSQPHAAGVWAPRRRGRSCSRPLCRRCSTA